MARPTKSRRRNGTLVGATVLALAAGFGCTPPDERPAGEAAAGAGGAPGVAEAPDSVPDEALARARGAADALTGTLKERLVAELSSEGPVAAVEVCSEVAQELTGKVSGEGVRVRRVSRRWRNPADRPGPLETEILVRLDSLHAAGELPPEVTRIVREDGERTLLYMRPLTVAGPCLQCHGDPAGMDPAVVRLIRERYPRDRAVGYSVGDFRGAVSVRVDLGGS